MKYIAIIGLVFIIALVAGCATTAPSVTTGSIKYSSGDIVTTPDKGYMADGSQVGMLIRGYDAKGDVYIIQGVARERGGEWMTLGGKEQFPRINIDARAVKVDYISPQLF